MSVVTEDGVERGQWIDLNMAVMQAVAISSGTNPVRLESSAQLPESRDGWAHFAAVIDRRTGRTISVLDGKVVAK